MLTNTLEQEALLNRKDLLGSSQLSSALGLNPLSDLTRRSTQLSLSSSFDLQSIEQAASAFKATSISTTNAGNLFTLLDYAGNTTATARAITVGSTTSNFQDWVGSADTNDYYRFTLGATSNFNLSLSGLSADADVSLLDGNGSLITSSTNSSTTSESITRQLTAGTYFIRVYPYSGSTNYNLGVSATSVTPPDYAGNTTATARAITVGSTTSTFQDWVGSADTNDYYRFTLGATANFNLSLNGLSADVDVSLLDGNGTVITLSTAGGSSSESITRQLTAGTYYVRVYQYSGDTNYNLGVSATPATLPDYAGNTTATARAITVGSTTSTFQDWVGSADTNDYYRFTLGATANFNLSLSGLSSDADVSLLDGNGSLITSSTNSSTTSESITRQLTAGTYYVRVYQYSGNTNYNLGVSATSVTPPDYAGNTTATARAITVGSTTSTYQDWVGSADTNDYYRFTLGATSNFNLSLNGLSADADVSLLDSNGVLLYSSTSGSTTVESIARQLIAGTYFIRVYQVSGNTNYNLAVSAIAATPDPNPNPDPTDWYSQNLRDSGLISLTRSLASDGNLSRNDMIAIFRNATDGDTVDANELMDLRTIVGNSNRFTMADYVRVLSNNIANGNVANTNSGIGNLYAGSRTTQVEGLIGKWFLGTSRPTTSYSYKYVSGSLFQNGISANDIDQNALGDCYYLATLSSIAQEKPSFIQNMFIDNGDNTFTVRFFNSGVAEYVTVDRYLPTNSSGYQVYAGWGGGSSTSSTNELWVALAEKAYAQLAELGWSRPGSSRNAYSVIEGGWMDKVIQQVTGLATTSQNATAMTQTQLINLVNSNQILTAGFVNGSGYGVVNNHAYTITSYNATNATFHLRNPWGTNDADVTFAQLQALRGLIQWSNT